MSQQDVSTTQGQNQSSPRPPGRPRLDGKTTRSAFELMYRRLLEDQDWLREPATEGQIARILDVPKSSAREASKEFAEVFHALRRGVTGVSRHEPTIERLISLYGMRSFIEGAAFRVMNKARSHRVQTAMELRAAVRTQEAVSADDLVGWFKSGFNFHEKLLIAAESHALIWHLKSMVISIRLTSYQTPYSEQERKQVIHEHYALIDALESGGDWQTILKNHLRCSLGRVWRNRLFRDSPSTPDQSNLNVQTVSEDKGFGIPDEIWDQVLDLARID